MAAPSNEKGSRSTPAETVAHVLGRELVATQHFLRALAAVGVLELRGDRYPTTPAVARYLEAVGDGRLPTDWDT
jgi:hypothetical protein